MLLKRNLKFFILEPSRMFFDYRYIQSDRYRNVRGRHFPSRCRVVNATQPMAYTWPRDPVRAGAGSCQRDCAETQYIVIAKQTRESQLQERK